jgi:dihydrofolate reductase
MIISAIAAMASNRVIGKDGDLPWKIPEDFKFFRDKTMGRVMIMGRKTFETLGKPLPGRLHIVITRQTGYSPEGAIVVNNAKDALKVAQTKIAEWGSEIFVIGGGEIYSELLPQTQRIYLTEIHKEFPGDAKFPEFSKTEFVEIARSKRTEPVAFDFVTYERRK